MQNYEFNSNDSLVNVVRYRVIVTKGYIQANGNNPQKTALLIRYNHDFLSSNLINNLGETTFGAATVKSIYHISRVHLR